MIMDMATENNEDKAENVETAFSPFPQIFALPSKAKPCLQSYSFCCLQIAINTTGKEKLLATSNISFSHNPQCFQKTSIADT